MPAESAITEQVPCPEEVREQLGRALREVALLRSLLRLAERVERERQRAAGVVARAR
jgi:hypothetical protein